LSFFLIDPPHEVSTRFGLSLSKLPNDWPFDRLKANGFKLSFKGRINSIKNSPGSVTAGGDLCFFKTASPADFLLSEGNTALVHLLE
jgi:hypothetical protein